MPGVLEGLKVLALTTLLPGPYAAARLMPNVGSNHSSW
jgi:crotonobetainyl-CoA:carnitine CoA-transferase CaiB-like acyl-CoA transferase